MSSPPDPIRRPPRLADWLLSRTLPPGSHGESIRGDLIEEFQEPRALARTWFCFNALCLGGRYTLQRVLERRQQRRRIRLTELKEFTPMSSDLRQTVRNLIKNPGFLLASTLTIALGIGANATMFSVIHAVLLQPLPYAEPERLVSLWPEGALSHKVVDLLDERSSTLVDVAGTASLRSPLILPGTDPVELKGAGVTEGYFTMLGSGPLLGRIFLPEDHLPGAESVVILSHRLWQERFSADPQVLGMTIRMGSTSRTVVGVLPATHLPFDAGWNYWTPLPADPASPVYFGRTWLRTRARLAEGVSLEQAQAEVTRLAGLIAAEEPTVYGQDWVAAARVQPFQESAVSGFSTVLWILQGSVFLVFLIACSNIANLVMARGSSRRREIAVRFALGANRWRVVQQFMWESLLLGLCGGLLGILLTAWTTSLLRVLETGGMPLLERIEVGPEVVLFTLGFSILAAFLFGLGPAWINSREDSRDCLSQTRQPAGAGAQQGWRSLLVAGEVALAVILVCGAGLMISSLFRLTRVNPGFQPEQVVTMRLAPPRSAFSDGPALTRFFDECLERIRVLPWVREAGAIHMLPLASDGFYFSYVAPDQPIPDDQPRPTASVRLVAPGYFEAMGIPLLSGRSFQSSDRAESPAVALINSTLARKLWPNQEATGKKIHFFSLDQPPIEVVGVVGDVHQARLDSTPYPEIYRPLAQYPWDSASLTVRVDGPALNRIPELRSLIWDIHAETVISEASTMPAVVHDSLSNSRFYTLLISLFGLLALVLGLIGVYGVMSFAVNQRTHEIGVRMALGAGSVSLTRTLLAWGMKRVLLGIAVGLPGAAATTHLLGGLLYGVSPLDPSVLAGVTLLISGAACLAILLPARRATRIDPIRVLNADS